MNNTTIATLRIAHIIAALYNLFYVYTPLHMWQHGFQSVKWCSMPVLLVTGALLVYARKRAMAKVA
jgi:hypothetical protein